MDVLPVQTALLVLGVQNVFGLNGGVVPPLQLPEAPDETAGAVLA